ncbi:ankyrin repeat domain-containing protein [Streptomyces sp. XD-27]|uniref:ankyrin repeat domain-containing protein n=1 Tax=Streptomyces sp. XD-27 TaxID=3062779 RepID=UPI0026F415BF|nr:ankyrin repeat domain-containing protein [Streptomyces sp. XD-27]WKX68772.1 ankyrin repeat domain-containing protein [Streptomyces sp. XD-27]
MPDESVEHEGELTAFAWGPADPWADEPRGAPPADRLLPAGLPQAQEAGAGPEARVMCKGWSVWPDAATLHLAVFRRQARTDEEPLLEEYPAVGGGLRVGLLLADGQRVTTVDDPWEAAATGGIALRQYSARGGPYHHDIDLFLTGLPSRGDTWLVVEWPDEDVPETRTAVDAAALHEAAGRAVEIWPGDEPPRVARDAAECADLLVGPARLALRASLEGIPYEEYVASLREDPEPEQPRPDWGRMGWETWSDLDQVTARLAAGADPDRLDDDGTESPLHRAAEHGSAEVVAELAGRVTDVDTPDEDGCTPLWRAVCRTDEGSAAALLAAGADPWRPCVDGRSPGRLALTTSLAPLFEALPGAVPLTLEERAAQEEADRQIAVFADVMTEGLGAFFIAGLDEDEVIRRIGGDPRACPAVEPAPIAFEPYDMDGYVGVTGVDGGCVIAEWTSGLPFDDEVLRRLSAGTVAYRVFFNVKGGTFGDLARDGAVEHEEIGLAPELGLSIGGIWPEGHWRYRFWQSGPDAPYGAAPLAYGCAAAGLRLADSRPVTGPPRRWVPVE